MKAYIYALILTAVMAAVAEFLTDGGGSSGALRTVAGLCVLLTLIQPVKEGLIWLRGAAEGELEEWVELPDDTVNAPEVFLEQMEMISEQAVTEAVTTVLAERFGVPSGQCRVGATVAFDASGNVVGVESVTVFLSGSSILKNPHTIKAFLEQTFGGVCTVAVE